LTGSDKSKVPHTLLLADDSVAIQRVIELTFAEEDVQVVAVGDGDQAIARMEASPPDIILADIGMPGKNGYDVAQYVKDSPRLAHIPVVLLTGAFEPVDQARAVASGCEGVLAKPFEPHLVVDRVKELLAKGPRMATSDATPGRALADAPATVSTEGAWPAAPVAASAPKSPAELDTYFDTLDHALANLKSSEDRPAAEPTLASASEPAHAPAEPTATGADHDWFGAFNAADESTSDAAGMTLPPSPGEPSHALSYGSPAADFDRPLETSAEEEAPGSDVPPTWPSSTVPPAPASAVSDEAIEQIAQRVLAQLSDRIVRETVTGLVSAIAERLVREEIERIKNAVQ
jgi:CheY-like chemotaxis protein